MLSIFFFFFNDTATTEIYTLSLHDALPIPLSAVEALQLVPVVRPRRRLGVGVVDRPEVPRAPGLGRLDHHVADCRAEAGADRGRQPTRSVASLDPVAVLPAIFLVLHGVEKHEEVGGGPLGEVPEPRQIVRLVDRDFHRRISAALTAASRRSDY